MKQFFKKIIEMNTIKLYCVTLLYHFTWSFFVGAILYLSGVQFSQHVASSSEFVNSFLLVPMCALVEESLFRWGPMIVFLGSIGYITKIININEESKSKIEKYGTVTIVLISSIIFGLVHGNIFNILLQGVSGLIFFMFYLRTLYKEKMQEISDKFQFRPLISSTIYHTLSNSILIVL